MRELIPSYSKRIRTEMVVLDITSRYMLLKPLLFTAVSRQTRSRTVDKYFPSMPFRRSLGRLRKLSALHVEFTLISLGKYQHNMSERLDISITTVGEEETGIMGMTGM